MCEMVQSSVERGGVAGRKLPPFAPCSGRNKSSALDENRLAGVRRLLLIGDRSRFFVIQSCAIKKNLVEVVLLRLSQLLIHAGHVCTFSIRYYLELLSSDSGSTSMIPFMSCSRSSI